MQNEKSEQDQSVYDALNRSWKSTCRILFGGEIGELKEYETWLKELVPSTKSRTSYLSSREIKLTMNGYCDGAKFISLEEIKEKSLNPLTINEIKDIDSIAQAISDKWEYCGNKVLGNSNQVERCDDVIDSSYVSDSIAIDRCSYVFSSAMATSSKNCFGCVRFINGEFFIRSARHSNCIKCFNSYWLVNCNNIYCSTNLVGCSEMLFCFGQRGKSKCIGNLQLPSDKFLQLRKKLIDEIREEIKKEKHFPFIFELIRNIPPNKTSVELVKGVVSEQKIDMKPIEMAFSSTFKILFRKEAEGMAPYQSWISSNILDYSFDEIDTSFGSKTYRFTPNYYTIFSKFPVKRAVTYNESVKLSNLCLEEADLNGLGRILAGLSDIAYITEEGEAGKSINIAKSAYSDNDQNAYWFAGKNNENIAFCPYIFDSKYAFGCNKILNSQQVIRCNNSFKLTRCFELDSCSNCSDTYFAHNCESLSEAMFCWNVKGKRHAIGNAEIPTEQYRQIKDSLLNQMADEILEKKELKWDIYNIGCIGKKG